jgi:ribonuclease HII|tara:strand:- start:2059 stop:2688 length:630 start_codon:yes stop_codon:yes gene_type:complete
MLKQFYEKGKIEVGIDEAGRGCLFGPVFVASVVWLDEDPNKEKEFILKDSKKCSEKKRILLRKYIEENAIAYSVVQISEKEIDKTNILKATMKGMHQCIDEIRKQLEIDTILVDGNQFDMYMDEQFECINHECVIDGDNTYKSIAAASILAKTYRDEYIINLVKEYPELSMYAIQNNKGYGTKAHMDSIKENGITEWHRKTFKPCSNYL